MQTLTNSIISYVHQQIKSGVDAIQIFDTNASFLSKEIFEKKSLPYLKQIIDSVNEFDIPCILFVKGGGYWLDLLKHSGANVLGIDWTISLKEARVKVGDNVALQGNLDPSVLLSNNSIIKRETLRVLDAYGNGNGHIFNLGHGITPDVSPEAVKTVIETVQNDSQKFKVND
jgi:uroporphyrinogen decarboxylase